MIDIRQHVNPALLYEYKITIEGRKYLGGFIGSKSGCGEYEEELVNSWCEQLRVLSKIAKTEPQAAYAAFVNGYKHKLTYHIRTLPNIKQHLTRLDALVDQLFIPAITDDHMCSDDERLLISLPVKKGGLAIPIFSSIAELEFFNSRAATDQLIKHINDQVITAQIDNTLLKNSKRNIVKAREEHNDTILQQLRAKMSPEQLRANDLTMMKGASSWLTILPLKAEDYNLNKREFYDSLCLRYRWTPKYLPPVCPCGKSFNVDHAMSCMKGGFVHRRHDEVRDLFASLLQDVCHDVEIEPPLQALPGEALSGSTNSSDEARLDVSARGFWQRGQRAFFDVRVFNPFAKSHLNQKLETAFTSNEKKKRHYNQRVIEVEHGSFGPLVFSPYGGCGREAERFLTELAQKVSEKKQMCYSIAISWLRAKLSFNLLRSAVLCIRGSRTLRKKTNFDVNAAIFSNFNENM